MEEYSRDTMGETIRETENLMKSVEQLGNIRTQARWENKIKQAEDVERL